MHGHQLIGNRPAMFEGRNSRLYDFVSRRLLRGVYRRIADDIADSAPPGGHVIDAGTRPGVLLVELARRRPALRPTGGAPSAAKATTARRNPTGFDAPASAR